MALNEARAAGRRKRGGWTEAEDSPLRPDEVRRAFNGPFWPNVLVTTSIGQEGLDFHPWCKALAHWDLCSGPVALEQREGRVSRFAGLSVRRAIAARLSTEGMDGGSPWKKLQEVAEAELTDPKGLEPWWVARGSSIQRLVFSVPGSETPERLAKVNRERALYRLVLGMPDQTDLLQLIASRDRWDRQTVQRACLDLSAWGRRNGETDAEPVVRQSAESVRGTRLGSESVVGRDDAGLAVGVSGHEIAQVGPAADQ